MRETRARRPAAAGFTLIEVIGALLVFSVGVIMLLQITSSLARQLEWAALNSVIVAEGQERIDSLSSLPYASLTVGTDVDTMTLRGVAYRRRQVVSQYTPLVREAEVELEPIGADGPTFAANTFVSDPW